MSTEAPVSGHSKPGDEPIDYANLYRHEKSWPYRVTLTEAWKPAGWEGRFGWGVGILVRVESTGRLRIDFASLGKYLVPAEATNVIEEANRIRRGELRKPRPNFVNAVGTRLLDLASDRVRPVAESYFDGVERILVLFADPTTEDFRTIAAEIALWARQSGTVYILFPQGGHRDGATLNACRSSGWGDPVLFDRFVVPMTASYLGEVPEAPVAMLLSPEGRLIFSGAWNTRTRRDLRAVLDPESAAR